MKQLIVNDLNNLKTVTRRWAEGFAWGKAPSKTLCFEVYLEARL